MPEALEGLEPEGEQEDFYPLVGNFLTPVYQRCVNIGGEAFQLRFGRLPDEILPILEAGGVKAILGTGLLKQFGICLSVRDQVLKLDPVITRVAA